MDIFTELLIDCADDIKVIGDELLMKYMLENLIDESLRCVSPGVLKITVCIDGDFVRFDFIDTRRNFPQAELNMLFYPDNSKIYVSDDKDMLCGTEYLLCKQIIRDHDEFGGKRGCRINASALDGDKGFSVWFTLPLKKVLYI